MFLWRGLAGMLALAALWPAGAGIVWALLVFLIAAHGPDPVGEGQSDPCCDYADTWGDVAFGIAWGLTLVVVSVALLYAAITLASFARRGEWPKLLRLRAVLASLAAVGAAVATYWGVLFVLY